MNLYKQHRKIALGQSRCLPKKNMNITVLLLA